MCYPLGLISYLGQVRWWSTWAVKLPSIMESEEAHSFHFKGVIIIWESLRHNFSPYKCFHDPKNEVWPYEQDDYLSFFLFLFFGLFFKFIKRDQEIFCKFFLWYFQSILKFYLINYALQYGCTILLSKLTRHVCHIGLAIYIKKYIVRQKKKNYGNSSILPCKNIIIVKKKSSERNQNPSRYYL